MGHPQPIEVIPEGEDLSLAVKALERLAAALQVRNHRIIDKLELTENMVTGLTAMLEKMAEGEALSIDTMERDYTTREAAKILRFSQGHLYKLLDSGQIPFKKVGSHRRIDARNLFTYKNKLEEERKRDFDEMARLSQGLNDE